MNPSRVILAGGSGFIGRSLSRELRRRHYEVVILTRHPQPTADGSTEVAWDGETTGPWVKSLEGAAAVVNLTGRNINCPHTPENLADIIGSRVKSVRALAAALPLLSTAPRVWVQASAVGFYGETGNHLRDETSPAGTGTLAGICREWEAAFDAVAAPGLRKVLLRIGLVLGRHGGALPILSKLTRLFLGGSAGNGRQYISWIHITDLRRMFIAAIEEELSGVYNAVAPEAVTNAEFMRALRHACHRPWSPPAPEFAIRLGCRLMRSDPSLALMSTRCEPRRFLAREFKFQFHHLDRALLDLCF